MNEVYGSKIISGFHLILSCFQLKKTTFSGAAQKLDGFTHFLHLSLQLFVLFLQPEGWSPKQTMKQAASPSYVGRSGGSPCLQNEMAPKNWGLYPHHLHPGMLRTLGEAD